MGLLLHLRDTVFRIRNRDAIPVPLDPDLLWLAEQAKNQSVIQDIYRQQMERNRFRPHFGDTYDPGQPRDPGGKWTEGGGSSRKTRSQAKKGGEIAESNKAFYKGGQFLPSTEAPPGTYKIKGKVIGKGRELTEPGGIYGGQTKWDTAPTPLHRSIWTLIGNYVQMAGEGKEYLDLPPYTKRAGAEAKAKGKRVQFDWDKKKWYTEIEGRQGEIEIRPNAKGGDGSHIDRDHSMRFGVKGHLTTEPRTVGDLIDRYNKGERWVEV